VSGDVQEKLLSIYCILRLAIKGYNKAIAIIELEAVLKKQKAVQQMITILGGPGRKYYFSVFGNPAADSIWGWRLEAILISFQAHYLQKITELVSPASQGFGGQSCHRIIWPGRKADIKDEGGLGFTLLHSLDANS